MAQGWKEGPVGVWQRYEEATMCQSRPADPTDPGDAADLSIMGYEEDGAPSPRLPSASRFAQEAKEINSFLTSDDESLALR